MTKRELEIILKVKIIVEPDKGCWIIKGRDWSNYTTIKGKVGHRLVYQLCVGPLIPGREICHKCDRKGCINYNHLFQGTHSQNMRDALNKGRLERIKVKTSDSIGKKLREMDRWKKLHRFAGE